ncbi:MAG TPA: hypothetical protein VHI78_12435 [Bacteroidales bacterium]|jgi:hypothetical protein|nr:hypothetical protein [Bacteroidales bacterium]
MKTAILVIFLILFSLKSFNQNNLAVSELTIQKLHQKIKPTQTDSENISFNDSIAMIMEQTLNLPGAFVYPFDSLKFIGKIMSDDQKLRIFTWNLPFADASNRYFGFIMYEESNKNSTVYKLKDNSAGISNPEIAEIPYDSWYGCLIYDIIDTKSEGDTWYTLLGYDPDNIFTSKKLIDILWFREGQPAFGKPVFQLNKRLQSRILFEYSARVQMTLTWHQKLRMIVFDHLAPSNPSYQGNFRYYGPDFSYDGLKFENGIWEIHEDIDVRGQ